MSFITRLEKSIEKKERIKDKEKMKIEELREKLDNHSITRAEFNIKKKKIEEKIRAIDSRIRVLQGGISKEKKHQEEKHKIEQEKKKKKKK